MKDALGDRMKSFYEDRFRYKLPRRSFTILRVDGKAFHTYTRGLKRPFDKGLIEDMNLTATYLCENIQGAKMAYVQSDEISVVLTDFDDLQTDAWFDGNLQKMCSIASSLATAKFNQLRMERSTWEGMDIPGYLDQVGIEKFKLALFDARVFQIPFEEEVINYFIWRQQDATRNSISSVAQSLYSAKDLHGKKTDELQEMIFQKGINWNDFSPREKRGGVIRKVEKTYLKRGSEVAMIENPEEINLTLSGLSTYTRKKWEADPETPIFSKEKEYLRDIIVPKSHPNEEEST
jgi:tRNA(His) guanylyltransferase